MIDLFAGCGGLTEGFEQTGLYSTIACVDWEAVPCHTLARRLQSKWGYVDAEKRVVTFDIQRSKELVTGWHDDPIYNAGTGLDGLVAECQGIDIVMGGPPCQAYSMAGRIRDEFGMHYDYRNYLFESYLSIVGHLKPKAILFENVPGILSAKPGGVNIINRIQTAFSDTGYELIGDIRKFANIDFTSFGIPQRRSRIVLVGLRKSDFTGDRQYVLQTFYDGILDSYKKEGRSSVRHAIGDLPRFIPAGSDYMIGRRRFSHQPRESSIANHVPRYHNRRDIEIFRELAEDIELGEDKYGSIESLQRLYTARTGRISNVHKYYVLRWNEPSNTIPAHLYKDGLRHIHPDSNQARTITVREAARLQTFDDDFEFMGGLTDQYKMVGNAVPPLFARVLGFALHELMVKFL